MSSDPRPYSCSQGTYPDTDRNILQQLLAGNGLAIHRSFRASLRDRRDTAIYRPAEHRPDTDRSRQTEGPYCQRSCPRAHRASYTAYRCRHADLLPAIRVPFLPAGFISFDPRGDRGTNHGSNGHGYQHRRDDELPRRVRPPQRIARGILVPVAVRRRVAQRVFTEVAA